ncbi:hypothetical protein MES4922_60029 [Mesorhizobium ventifaucium]|uniref:Uncharacterized protein n=1 Tax=Mesorhizobium ventifaucium TaxID=666020 RepID=A0ABM9EDX5_9HYPH|nr:hypothetical protein MES4922_60029 [Mesorhizobium ventifaucium]
MDSMLSGRYGTIRFDCAPTRPGKIEPFRTTKKAAEAAFSKT